MPPELTDPGRDAASVGASSDAVRARLVLVALCLGWGTGWVSMRIALDEIEPFTMRTSGQLIGASVLFALGVLQGRDLRISGIKTWGHVAVASLFNIVAFGIFTAFAQLITDTSRVTILVYTMPVWATLLALPILGERLTVTRMMALALCVAGMAILLAPLAVQGFPVGTVLAIGGAMSWAAGTVYLKWAHSSHDPMTLAAWQLVFGFCVMSVCIPLFDHAPTLNVSVLALSALVYSGIAGSGLGLFLWFHIVQRLPATTASLGVLASPVIGVIAAMIVLGERPTLYDAIGFVLMLSASALVMLRPERARDSS